MNSEKKLSHRLLKLFPVKVLKNYFNSEETSNGLFREIIDTNTKSLIDDFAYSNLDFTKQHIYIFDITHQRGTLNTNISLELFPYEVLTNRIIEDNLHLVISPLVDFSTLLSNPFEQVVVRFHQPIKIVITSNHLIFYATILEKNINTYFDDTRKVMNVEKHNDETFVVKMITDYFQNLNPRVCDLNRGIKKLWEDDIVDSKYAQWKKSRSTTTETMDENYTLKSQYPEVYQGLITAPIKKTVFKYLLNDDEMPENFTADPGMGQISIPLFPKSLNQNQNVVKKILSNN